MVVSNTAEGVVLQTLLEFADSRPVHIVEHPPWRSQPREDIVGMAIACGLQHAVRGSHAGGRKYHLMHWNCEHFANYCVTGQLHAGSAQVRNVVGMGLWAAVMGAFSPVGAAAVLALGLASMVTP